ncbi:MAG: UDP-N-acetylglucosamine--N-acetylmuramyl-(pentapeptide) pyrophosphoryl-undecaprenol N-acetylglucosamine transferase [Crocinitomicaceae bacterium]|jgi:UDP-N-acetylglucosamine--N-acetylmuramyl-(pentapeptide) pyrophosphoryl-undecaprenol N-acetylglucosamine transferase
MIKKAIVSGGGTGGHIFPAIAIADEIKGRNPDAEILFVGATGKMEMEKVPQAGYKIEGLDIVGFKRKLALSNFLLPFKIVKSVLKAKKIVRKFDPDVVVGVGGYASGPTLKAASMLKFPTALQEQNAFAGKTNKILSKKAKVICVAYEGLERFFPAEKIILTGNPTRNDMVDILGKREEAYKEYGFDPNKKTILIIGGSLGARTLNESVVKDLGLLAESGVQVLWQCGKLYNERLLEQLKDTEMGHVKMVQFIMRMDLAYAMADVIISRAGAISVSELCLIHKPAILVPSPNVAEDHQTKNAMALVEKNAAILVKDIEAKEQLIPAALELIENEYACEGLIKNIQPLGKPNATVEIVDELEKIAK